MAVHTQTKAWILQNKPAAAVNFSSSADAMFALIRKTGKLTLDIPSPIPEDSLLLKPIWISNDPAQRGWIQKGIDPKRLYVPPVEVGEVMHARAVAKVIKVGGSVDMHKEGDLVLAATGWTEYAVLKKSDCRIFDSLPGYPPSIFLGVLGISGLTAYWGLREILKLQAGETIVISGAAGAVGNVAIQLAKHIFGAKKVIAIVGSEEKAQYVKSLGANVALNYKNPHFEKELIEATQDYAETYFDNVGGEILDLMFTRLKRHGRIAACGAISTYNDLTNLKLQHYFELITNRLELKGFVVTDYLTRPEGSQALISALKEGKLVIGGETIVEVSGIEEIPKVWYRLFEGRNQGKLLTKLPE
ncbi:NAD(P)-binding protein [Ramaria rubella]|nr:NAD(P)-binding protein [Ramaria rubella]